MKKGTQTILSIALVGTTILNGVLFLYSKKDKPILKAEDLSTTRIMYIDEEAVIIKPAEIFKSGYLCMKGHHYKDILSGDIYHVTNYSKNDIEQTSEKCINFIFGQASKVTSTDILKYFECNIPEAINLYDGDVSFETITNKLNDEQLEKIEDGKFMYKDLNEFKNEINSEFNKTKTFNK